MLPNILILVLLEVSQVHSSTYFFRRTNVLGRTENWENGDSPCEDDRIRFDQEKITTALISGGLQSQTIDLPNNGILFFDVITAVGKLGNWQCEKRQNAEEVYFKQSPSLGFHNGSNWMLLDDDNKEWRPALHALQVPSSQDIAVVPPDSGTRVLVEDFVTVGTLLFAGRVSNFYTCFSRLSDFTLEIMHEQGIFCLAFSLSCYILTD